MTLKQIDQQVQSYIVRKRSEVGHQMKEMQLADSLYTDSEFQSADNESQEAGQSPGANGQGLARGERLTTRTKTTNLDVTKESKDLPEVDLNASILRNSTRTALTAVMATSPCILTTISLLFLVCFTVIAQDTSVFDLQDFTDRAIFDFSNPVTSSYQFLYLEQQMRLGREGAALITTSPGSTASYEAVIVYTPVGDGLEQGLFTQPALLQLQEIEQSIKDSEAYKSVCKKQSLEAEVCEKDSMVSILDLFAASGHDDVG